MATYRICSVFDMVSQQWGRPFYAVSDGSATRSFGDEVNTPSESVVYKHPGDFQLFVLGTFDDGSGQIVLLDTPLLLVSASALVRPADLQP